MPWSFKPAAVNRIIKKPPLSQTRHKITLIEREPIRGEKDPEKEISPEEKKHFKEQAENVVKQAKEEAEKLLTAARAKAQEIFEQAQREGFTKGYRESLEKAAAEAKKIREEAFVLLKQAKEIREETIKSLEQEIVQLALTIAAKIVHHQLTVAPETVLQTAREAIDLLTGREEVTLLVNPKEMDIFRTNQEEFLKSLPGGAKINILADPGIKPGGLKIRTEREEVDATLDGRWEALKEILGVQVSFSPGKEEKGRQEEGAGPDFAGQPDSLPGKN